jgi:hypothetical protein
MNQSQLEGLLGRSLTPIEVTNLKTYLNIAKQSLDGLLCTNLCDQSVTRTFDAREGYSTVFTDIFTDIQEVKLNDEVTTDYSVRQWDRRNGSWYNSIVFENKLCEDDEVEVTASWGFSQMPSDLKLVWAQLFGLISKKNKQDGTVSSKQIEDFRVTFKTDADLDDEFYRQYDKTIAKYSLCSIGNIQHGETRSAYYI